MRFTKRTLLFMFLIFSTLLSDDDQPLDQIISVKFSDRATKELTDKFDNGCFIASGFKDLNNNSKICIFCMKSFDVKLPEFENHMKKCLQTLPFP